MKQSKTHYKYPKIRSFKEAMLHAAAIPGLVTYEIRVKMHGANMAVVFNKDGFYCQSRNRIITPKGDAFGFAAEVHDKTDPEGLAGIYQDGSVDVLYGEWVGPKIQTGVALAKLGRRHFVPFDLFNATLGTWESWEQPVITWTGRPSLASERAKLQEFCYDLAEAVGRKCPVGLRLGVEGSGEGIVAVPTGEHVNNRDLCFKMKASSFECGRKAPPKPLDTALEANIDYLVDKCITQERLRQGLTYLEEHNLPLTKQSTGQYIKWVLGDIKEECQEDFELAQVEFNQFARRAGTLVANAYFERLK